MKARTREDAALILDAVDMNALDRAIVAARAEGDGRSEQLDTMLKDRPWLDVAEFAASCAQSRALRLKPWESPPSWGDPDGDEPHDVLLARMLDAGVSRYEPDAAKIAPCRRKARPK